ncbi:hypothetical protein [Tropicibacter sp. S64]|uniref:hypothetical protein n=1 Tax=Tropicibacter sp. S64 TaxID=3415122 RepID=UPI003C7E800F
MKTYLLSLLVLVIGAVTPALALPNTVREQTESFASCLGRYSATMEHEWLLGRDGMEARERRALFETLLEAITPDARAAGLDGPQVLHIRIEAKMTQARLLSTAHFDLDPRRARYARITAERLMSTCQQMVLG